MPTPHPLDRLLRPRSVAIVGASAAPGALGAGVLQNLEQAGFPGAIHLVNPRRAEIGGRPCLATIDDLPEGIDCAVLAIPRAAVLESLQALGRRKAGAAIVFSSGFAEAGPGGRAEQEALARTAREAGMALLGPNCLGIVNFLEAAPLTFVQTPVVRPEPGPCVAIVSQSGAMAAVASVALRSRGMKVALTVSTGNEAGSGVEDYVEHLIGQPQVRAIVMIVEQLRDPARFLQLARSAHDAGQRIVMIHPGHSAAARDSAATHTGALAGDHRVMEVKVRHAGVILVDTFEELLDVSELALSCDVLPTRGAMVLAESGWFKAQALDLCERAGLPLPALSPAANTRLRSVLPDFIPPTNPLDITAQGLVDPSLYTRTIEAVLAEDAFGSLVLPIILTDPDTANIKLPPILEALKAAGPSKPVVFAGLDEGAEFPAEHREALRALGVPFFPSPERALRALAVLTAAGGAELRRTDPPAAGLGLLPAEDGVIPEHRAKAVLATLGVPVPPGRLARTVAEAQAAAREVGYPLALKAQSPALSHKSDAGGVILHLGDEAAVAEGWVRLHANLATHAPGLALDGVLVERMGRRGLELIVGVRSDPKWGPVVLVGLGGVLAELMGDSRLLPADLPREAITAELRRLHSAALFDGYRGEPPLDLDALVDIVEVVGRLACAEPRIREIDVNPVVLYPRGEGAVALDALMLLEGEG